MLLSVMDAGRLLAKGRQASNGGIASESRRDNACDRPELSGPVGWTAKPFIAPTAVLYRQQQAGELLLPKTGAVPLNLLCDTIQ